MSVETESFEGLSSGSNSPLSAFLTGLFQPGFESVYVFKSGLRLLSPIPNTAFEGVYVGDFNLDPGPIMGLGSNGKVDDPSYVPAGSAFLLSNEGFGSTISFGFNVKVYKVGAYVDSAKNFGDHETITAYDAKGHLIPGASIRSVPVEDWDTNYIQVMSNKPIAKVDFGGQYIVIDKVEFDTSKPHVINGNKDGGKVNGTKADDLILGKNGNDKIKAKDGADTVYGKNGNDKISCRRRQRHLDRRQGQRQAVG